MAKQETMSIADYKKRYLKEEDIQSMIRADLLSKGYICLQTTHRTRMQVCSVCGQKSRSQGGYGADYGVPDLLVSHAGWKDGAWLGLEVKGPKTPLSPHQQDLLAKRRIFVVRSVEEALEAVSRFEA